MKDSPKNYPKLMTDKEGSIYLVFFAEMEYHINILEYKGSAQFYMPCFKDDNLSRYTEFTQGNGVEIIQSARKVSLKSIKGPIMVTFEDCADLKQRQNKMFNAVFPTTKGVGIKDIKIITKGKEYEYHGLDDPYLKDCDRITIYLE